MKSNVAQGRASPKDFTQESRLTHTSEYLGAIVGGLQISKF